MTKVLKLLGGGWLPAVLGVALILNVVQLMKSVVLKLWSMATRLQAAVSLMDSVWDVCHRSPAHSYPRPRGFGLTRSHFSSA